jgi:hypothetical protein
MALKMVWSVIRPQMERTSQGQMNARAVNESDRERVRFIIRTIVHPPARDEE